MENNSTKISLTTAICIILIILLIIALIFVYITSNKKIKDLEDKTALLEKQITTKLEENINENKKTEAEDTEKTNTSDVEKVYSYKDVKGKYLWNEKGDDYSEFLILEEDGTFKHGIESSEEMGNYIIDKNIIILNIMFSHGSGVGLDVIKDTIKCTINNDLSITGNISNVESSPITMKKISNETDSMSGIREAIKGAVGEDCEVVTFNY